MVIKPMKLTDVGPAAAESYITDPNFIMQQKMDGARVMLVWKDGVAFWTNDGVKPLAFSAAKLKLPALNFELATLMEGVDHAIFDGELIIETGVFWVFDILAMEFKGETLIDLETMNLKQRIVQLAKFVSSRPGGLFIPVPTAWTESEKRELFEAINESGVEGAVSKDLRSMYIPQDAKGRNFRTKEWVKHKLVKTSDVIVTGVERKFDEKGMVTHGSAKLSVYRGPDSSELVPVGNASLIGKELTIETGSVVEISFLYWTGKAVIQPRIMIQRFDKTADQCDLDQFPTYTRAIAWMR